MIGDEKDEKIIDTSDGGVVIEVKSRKGGEGVVSLIGKKNTTKNNILIILRNHGWEFMFMAIKCPGSCYPHFTETTECIF